jgi:DNA-binding NarL/FixJ family response regulator
VLIADDHQIVREGLHAVLTDGGAVEVVGEASTGEEAVRVAATTRPDVVLMDLRMPGAGGIEATRQLRAAVPDARVLILTTYAEEGGVGEAIRAGAIGYLLKDVGKAELLRAVRAAAGGTPTLHPQAQSALLREVAAPPTPASPLDALTPRERDVLRLVARGESNKRIAAQLNLSEGTVKGYLTAIFGKLGVGDRTQAALAAVRLGLG